MIRPAEVIIMFGSIEFPRDWLGALSEMIRDEALGLSKKTVTALCIALTDDDPAAGIMLEQVLYWYGRNQRAFYMSADQWKSDYSITPSRSRRAKKILALCGVLTHIKKANGAPTTHYSLNPWRFVARLARVVKARMSELLNRFSVKAQMDLAESGKSLTITTTTNNNNNNDEVDSLLSFEKADEGVDPENVVYHLLVKNKVHPTVAKRYTHLAAADVEAIIEQSLEADNVAACIVSKLKKMKYTPSSKKKTITEDVAVEREPVPLFGNAPVYPMMPDVDDEHLASVIADGWSAGDLWRAVVDQLELKLDSATFDSLGEMIALDYVDGVFTVRVANAYAQMMLQDRLYRNISRILSDISGRDLSIEFVVYRLPVQPIRPERNGLVMTGIFSR